MSDWLSVFHGIEYLLTSLWLGGLFFYAWIVPAESSGTHQIPDEARRLLLRLGGIYFGCSLVWCILLSAEMSESWRVSEITGAILATRFGHLWCLRLGLLAAGLLLLRSNRLRAAFLVSLGLPMISTYVGHAGSRLHAEWLSWSVFADGVHFVGVSLWAGGLVALFHWLSGWIRRKPPEPERDLSYRTVVRFSKLAMTCTGALAIAGLVLALLYGVDPFHPWSTRYGTLVLTKVGLFGIALAAASVNQFVHLRRWNPAREREFSRGVLREVGFEILLVIAVFLVAGFLSRTDLPGA